MLKELDSWQAQPPLSPDLSARPRTRPVWASRWSSLLHAPITIGTLFTRSHRSRNWYGLQPSVSDSHGNSRSNSIRHTSGRHPSRRHATGEVILHSENSSNVLRSRAVGAELGLIANAQPPTYSTDGFCRRAGDPSCWGTTHSIIAHDGGIAPCNPSSPRSTV